MADTIVISAEFREDVGKGASRRLRKHANKVPGILYGGGEDPVPLLMEFRELTKAMEEEAFYSQVLEVAVQDKSQQAVLRDLQRDPASDRVMHVDFLRIRADRAIQVSIPLHFINEDVCIGVKTGDGTISHNLIEVEVSCLPADLPEYIEVDMGNIDLNESVHLTNLELPEGVAIVALIQGEDHDITVASVQPPRGGGEEDEFETTDEADEEGGEEGDEEAGEGDDADG